MSSDVVCGPVSDAGAVVGVVYRVGDWLPGEEDRMIEMYNSGADILCMRDTLGRAAGSICARLKKLFKIDYNDIRGYTDYKNSDEYANLIKLRSSDVVTKSGKKSKAGAIKKDENVILTVENVVEYSSKSTVLSIANEKIEKLEKRVCELEKLEKRVCELEKLEERFSELLKLINDK
jgi:hypothetical protein